MQTTEETNNEYLQAKQAEKDHEGLMYGAQWGASHYISPTDADIAEAGPEWKKGGVHYFLETCDFRNDSGTLTQISDIHAGEVLQPLPVMEVEELAHLPKRRNPTSYDWWWA